MSDGSRAAGGAHSERGRASERERNNIGAAVALAAVIACAWPAPAGAQTAPLTLTVTPARERLERVSQEVREAVRIIDSDDGAARADRLWRMYVAVARRGNAALLRWAFELQSVVRGRKGNYLHALCWVLNEHDSARARAFATELARRGVAIGPSTGHYEDLDHLDPSEEVPALPPRVGNTPIGRHVDAFGDIKYDLSYRPEKKGQLSRLLQVTYEGGVRLDIDIRLISDSFDPANNQSLGRLYLGPGGRLYPLRMDRLSTPNLWAAKHAALAEMRRYNQAFEELVTISTGGAMLPLGLAVPVQQPAAGAVTAGRAANASRSTAARGATTALPQFTRSTIDGVISSSARLRPGGRITEGARAIGKKLGHARSGGYRSAFAGIKPTQENAKGIIRNILENPARTFYGDKVIDVYNAAGQGVRFDRSTGLFRGFL